MQHIGETFAKAKNEFAGQGLLLSNIIDIGEDLLHPYHGYSI